MGIFNLLDKIITQGAAERIIDFYLIARNREKAECAYRTLHQYFILEKNPTAPHIVQGILDRGSMFDLGTG